MSHAGGRDLDSVEEVLDTDAFQHATSSSSSDFSTSATAGAFAGEDDDDTDPDGVAIKFAAPVLVDPDNRVFIRQHHSFRHRHLTVIRQRANLRPDVVYLDDAPDLLSVACSAVSEPDGSNVASLVLTLQTVPWATPAEAPEGPLVDAVEAILEQEQPSLSQLVLARRKISINQRRLTAVMAGTLLMGGPRLGGCTFSDGTLLNGTDFIFLQADAPPRAALSTDRKTLTISVRARPATALNQFLYDTSVDVFRGSVYDFVKHVAGKKPETSDGGGASPTLRTAPDQPSAFTKYDDVSVWGLLLLRTLVREHTDTLDARSAAGPAPPPAAPASEDVWVDATPDEILAAGDGDIAAAIRSAAAGAAADPPAKRRRRALLGGISLDQASDIASGLVVLSQLSDPASAVRNFYSESGAAVTCVDCATTTGMSFAFKLNPFSQQIQAQATNTMDIRLKIAFNFSRAGTYSEAVSEVIAPLCIRPICFGIDLWGQSINAGVRFGLDKVVGFQHNASLAFVVDLLQTVQVKI